MSLSAGVIILLIALVTVIPTAANNTCGIKNGTILHKVLKTPLPISPSILWLVASSTSFLNCPNVIGPCAEQNPSTLHILSVTSFDGATNPFSASVFPPLYWYFTSSSDSSFSTSPTNSSHSSSSPSNSSESIGSNNPCPKTSLSSIILSPEPTRLTRLTILLYSSEFLKESKLP